MVDVIKNILGDKEDKTWNTKLNKYSKIHFGKTWHELSYEERKEIAKLYEI